ncbi:MAG TPA: hypothetical protein VG435_09725 [Acidimicrobiales bacterium]|jgi:hypothetical protein|nr:hypothetical protein [Acidimicrobiales bacterium]
MAPPTTPGQTDGQTQAADGRTWTWSAGKGAWLPTDPQPFEQVTGTGGNTWYFDSLSQQWVNSQSFPDQSGISGGDPIHGTVREIALDTDDGKDK